MTWRVLSCFAGIGGFDLAGSWAGIETAAFIEIEPFCQTVLRKHWPGTTIFNDIRNVTADLVRDTSGPIDIVWGGPPCQPASVAGKRQGSADERWLWPEFLRLVFDLRPLWVLAENPPGIIGLEPHGLDWILGELEAQGYQPQAFLVGADDVGASSHVAVRSRT